MHWLVESFADGAGHIPDDAWPRRAVTAAGAEPDSMLTILRPHTNLAIWHRASPRKLRPALGALVAHAPFVATSEGPPDAAIDALVGRLPMPVPVELLADIWWLAGCFAELADTGGAVRIRLEGITGRGCHRWHADAIGLRMLCTYRGAGTLALPVDGGAGLARSLREAALPTRPIRIPTSSVAILKGEGHAGNAGSGCIHRSPPPGARPRLLLCIDAPGRIPLE